jgi:hypothetical protein
MTALTQLLPYESCIFPLGVLFAWFKRPFEMEPNDPSS